jgi:hypothetical protein
MPRLRVALRRWTRAPRLPRATSPRWTEARRPPKAGRSSRTSPTPGRARPIVRAWATRARWGVPCCGGLGLKCIKDSPKTGTCFRACAGNTDCGDAGCCTDLRNTGDLECAPLSACQSPCIKTGGACTADPGKCCHGVCVTGTNPDFLGCRPPCTTNDDCFTGCCQLFTNSTNGFCADARYCSCTPVGGDCSQINCCGGSTCVTFQPDGGPPLACYKDCTQGPDCDSGCCSGNIVGKNYGSCVPKTPGACR